MEMKEINLNGSNYRYLEFPNPGKPKVLLIHGVIVESHCWERVIPFLQADYHIYAIDQKGHGESSRGKSYIDDYTPEIIAGDLFDFYKKVIQEPFYLVGHSLGGQFSMAYAALHSDTLKKLVILESLPSLTLKALLALRVVHKATPTVFPDKESVFTFYNLAQIKGLGEYMLQYAMTQNDKGGYELSYDKEHIHPRSLMGMRARNKYLWRSIPKISVPTLIVKAGKSVIIDQKMSLKMKRLLKESEMVEIKDSGHELVFGFPKEVAEALKTFFSH